MSQSINAPVFSFAHAPVRKAHLHFIGGKTAVLQWGILALMVLTVSLLAGCDRDSGVAEGNKVLNVLAWVGYDERELIDPFEETTGTKVRVKTYVGGDQMYSLFSSSKGLYDVVVVDPEYIVKLHAMGRLSELNSADYAQETANYFAPFKRCELCNINGKQYAQFIRYGSCALVYNTEKLTEQEVASYDILLSDKLKDKVGIWDWYLPSMGVYSRAAGNAHAYNISDTEFDTMKVWMNKLRPQARAIYASPPEMFEALKKEDVWAIPAAGEWVAVIPQEEGYPIGWTVPKEGGVMWSEALVIPDDAKNTEMAVKYIRYLQTPEAQALLSQRKAYKSAVANKQALPLLTTEQREQLKLTSEEQILDIAGRLDVRVLPVQQTEAQWQEVWSRFKLGE